MDLDARLSQAFDRGFETDGAALPPEELPYYLAQKFILSYEMSGLSGYFYNTLPDLASVQSHIDALRFVGLSELADVLVRARRLFETYENSTTQTTWGEILAEYDPKDLLETFEREIESLDRYGISS